jgi:hypothetical protein
MRFQIVRTRPGLGVEERLQIYSDKHNADLWLADQGAVANPDGTTVLIAADEGVVWHYRVDEIEDAEPVETPPAPPSKPRAASRRTKKSSRSPRQAAHPTR